MMKGDKYLGLSEDYKKQFKEICDSSFGETYTYGENKQPLYFTETYDMIDPDHMVSEFMKYIRKQKLLEINYIK